MDALVQRGDLLEVWVNESPHVPVELIALGRERSADVCHFLEGQSASSKLVFLKCPHGGLGDKAGLVLRIETVINDPEEFRVRKQDLRDGKQRAEWVQRKR